MSVFFVMLGIPIESHEHVLGPPRVSLDSEKNNFFFILNFCLFPFLSHFLMV